MTEEKVKETIEFIRTKAYIAVNQSKWRYGQALFNSVYEYYPDFANTVRGTELDCFEVTERIVEFEKSFKEYLLKLET